jgi:putative phage-type endonuclease
MDSDYIPSSESDNDNSSIVSAISCVSIQTSILEELTENDFCDIMEDTLEQIDTYMQTEIVSLSSPNFYSNMIECIVNTIYEDWIIFNICEDIYESEIYSELSEFVEQLLDNYLSFANIPKRARAYSIDIENTKDYNFITNQIAYLQSIPQPAQKTKEWYEFRNGLISASNLWKVFGSESQRNSLIYEKCQPANINENVRFSIETPMHWGNKYEPVTVMVYEHMFDTKIGEFGCIQHPKYPFIGASPDGINIDPTSQRYGRMLEIKNIVNREITGIPKEEYWVQTQIQMEVCELDECDFMETRFLEYSDAASFYEDCDREYRGVILHFVERDLKQGSMPIYKYMPLSVELEKSAIDEWINETREQCREERLALFTIIYWYLNEYSCVLIERNRHWFSSAVPKIEEIWRIIEKERVEGYEHRAVKKRISVSMNTDLSNSYMIKNMPTTNSICLVKLE